MLSGALIATVWPFRSASVATGESGSVHFASIPFPEMPDELKTAAVSAAVLPEPYASGVEEAQGGVPLADLDQGATTNFPNPRNRRMTSATRCSRILSTLPTGPVLTG